MSHTLYTCPLDFTGGMAAQDRCKREFDKKAVEFATPKVIQQRQRTNRPQTEDTTDHLTTVIEDTGEENI